jgi:hypothetical protein
MVEVNWLIVLATAIIPLITGMIWYNKAVMGSVWMRETGITPEDGKKVNMVKMIGLTLLLGFFAAINLPFIVIHHMHLGSIFANNADALKDANSEISQSIANVMRLGGGNFRTFGHGALHGFMAGLFLGAVMIGMSALYEMKSFKYVLVHVLYWAITMSIMGGIICQYA